MGLQAENEGGALREDGSLRPSARIENTEDTRRLAAESALHDLWAQVLDKESIGRDEDFFDLGGQSLHVLELMALVDTHFNLRLPLRLVMDAPTIRLMAATIDSFGAAGSQGEDATEALACIVPIRTTGSRLPVLFVPPAGGVFLSYYILSQLLGREQPFYALHDTTPVPKGVQLKIEDMAHRYIRDMLILQPEGPYQIGGWSFGGFLAFEIARQMTEAGHEVARLMVIDSDFRITRGERSFRGLGSGIRTLIQMFYYSKPFVRNAMHVRLASAMRKPRVNSVAGRLGEFCRRTVWKMGIRNAAVAKALEENPGLADFNHNFDLKPLRRMRPYVSAIRAFRPKKWSGVIDLFAIESRERSGNGEDSLLMGWKKATSGKVEVHRIPGNHFTIFQPPCIETLAASIDECLLK
jgi:thioesterase domain-containing protein